MTERARYGRRTTRGLFDHFASRSARLADHAAFFTFCVCPPTIFDNTPRARRGHRRRTSHSRVTALRVATPVSIKSATTQTSTRSRTVSADLIAHREASRTTPGHPTRRAHAERRPKLDNVHPLLASVVVIVA